jgi:hypothetical protein
MGDMIRGLLKERTAPVDSCYVTGTFTKWKSHRMLPLSEMIVRLRKNMEINKG